LNSKKHDNKQQMINIVQYTYILTAWPALKTYRYT